MKAKRLLTTVLAGAMACSLLAGCGGSGSSTSGQNSQGSGSSNTVTNESTSDSMAVEGDDTIDELRIGFTSTVDSIAPFVSYGDLLTQVRFYMWEYLAVYDENTELQPQIAKSWTTNDGGMTYEVEIYDYITDAKGNAITAEDVAFCYDFYKTTGRSADLSYVSSIAATGDYTLEIKLTSNAVGIWDRVAFGCPILSKSAFEASGDEMSAQPIGTARYVVESFEPGASLVLTKREDYWQKDELLSPLSKANIGKMTFKFISDASQCAIALETGDVDISLALPMTTIMQYVDNSDYRVNIVTGSGIIMMMSGDSHSPVSDSQALRQAICYAIDNGGMVNTVNSGYGIPMSDIAPPTAADYNSAWDDVYAYSVDNAKAKLAEAGFGENEVTLSLLVPSVGSYKRYAEVVQGYLMAVGINVDINSVEPALYSSSLRDPSQYDLVIAPGEYAYSVQAWLGRLGQERNGGSTFNGFVDEKLEELIMGCSLVDNHTEENLNACHEYIMETAYAYGLFLTPTGAVISNRINSGELSYCKVSTQIYLAGCTFGK